MGKKMITPGSYVQPFGKTCMFSSLPLKRMKVRQFHRFTSRDFTLHLRSTSARLHPTGLRSRRSASPSPVAHPTTPRPPPASDARVPRISCPLPPPTHRTTTRSVPTGVPAVVLPISSDHRPPGSARRRPSSRPHALHQRRPRPLSSSPSPPTAVLPRPHPPLAVVTLSCAPPAPPAVAVVLPISASC
jgi:hypothetical protein